MKKTILFITLLLFGATLISCKKDDRIQIGILQLISHGALDKAREGFIAALEENGYSNGDNITITVLNPQGEATTMQTQAAKLVRQSDLILAIATPAAIAVQSELKSQGKNTPLLFTAVTDPVDAKLLDDMENPGGNITGTSDLNPINKQIDLIKELLPEATTLGILYNASEPNSEIQANLAEEYASSIDLIVKRKTVTNATEIKTVLSSLITQENVDVIYTPTDNLLASNMGVLEETILSLSSHHVPIIAGERDNVYQGASLTYSINYYTLGHLTGLMAKAILEGEKPGSISVATIEDVELIINKKQLDKLNIPIPEELLTKADEIIE